MNQVLTRLRQLWKGQRQAFAELSKEYDFTPNEMEVLTYLAAQPARDTAAAICETHGISRALVCRSVEFLVKKGYLCVESDEKDRRCVHLRLSQKAEPVVKKSQELSKRISSQLYRGIPENELNIFEQVLERMCQNAKAL